MEGQAIITALKSPICGLKVEGDELWRMTTWNIGSMTGRGRELAEEMHKRRIDVMCVQETRFRGNAARELGGDYKLVYS